MNDSLCAVFFHLFYDVSENNLSVSKYSNARRLNKSFFSLKKKKIPGNPLPRTLYLAATIGQDAVWACCTSVSPELLTPWYSPSPSLQGVTALSVFLGHIPLAASWEKASQKILFSILVCLKILLYPYTWLKVTLEESPGGLVVRNLPANAGGMVWPLVRRDSTCHGAI